MNDKELIIKRIIDKAENRAQNIISEAESKAQENIKKANLYKDEYIKNNFPSAKDYVADLVAKAKITSTLEAKKLLLNKKRGLLACIYDNAVEKLKTEKKSAKYKEYITSLIKNNAKNGDFISFSQSDKKLFNKKFVDDIATKYKLKITMSDEYQNNIGGVVIFSRDYDIDLSLDLLVEKIKDKYELEIAQMLFEDLKV